jgi:aspartate beta-hydroxylase
LTLPDTVKLLPDIDADRLRADLSAVEKHFREHANSKTAYSDQGDATGWDVLVLRCPGGDPEKIGQNAGGMEDFADTPYLELTPYVREILDGLRVPVRGVRFSSLAAGATVPEHTDQPYGVPIGWVRLHIPVITSDRTGLVLNGADYRWKLGEFWYADFGRPHSVYNKGDQPRVHLIIDSYISPELFELFPEDLRGQITPEDVLFFREERALPDALSRLHGAVTLPSSFLQLHKELPTPDQWGATDQDDVTAELRVQDGRLVLTVGEHDTALAHIGDGEFRPLCWTQEQTMVIAAGEDRPSILFRYRRGGDVVETERKQLSLTAD